MIPQNDSKSELDKTIQLTVKKMNPLHTSYRHCEAKYLPKGAMHRATGGARSHRFWTWEGPATMRSTGSGWVLIHHGSRSVNVDSTTHLALSSGGKVLENIQSYTYHGTTSQTQNTSAVWLLPHLCKGIDLWYKDSLATVRLIKQRTSAVVQLYKYSLVSP